MYSDVTGVCRCAGCILLLVSLSISKNIEEAYRTNGKKLHQAYMKDLMEHSASNVLVTDEMGYLHEDTLEYIVFKVHQILYDEMAKESLMKGKRGLEAEGQSSNLELQYELNKNINELDRHRAISRFKYAVLQKLQELYVNIFLRQIPQLRANIQKEIYNIDYRTSKKLMLHMHWEFQESFNAQVNLLSKVLHGIIRKVVGNIEASWYKGNISPLKLQYLRT
ncbi:hypothetical protein M8J76_011946 [Diaphorina citri]|nr:hypothetical protein M8J76_011946 [Diaphorina citri]KAI5746809.1 hypothetical protein M8J77_007648 [Diaphorina citri]